MLTTGLFGLFLLLLRHWNVLQYEIDFLEYHAHVLVHDYQLFINLRLECVV
ncbi:hypothetical protein Hanom_Chr10g00928701 [Helianthus anomalus]